MIRLFRNVNYGIFFATLLHGLLKLICMSMKIVSDIQNFIIIAFLYIGKYIRNKMFYFNEIRIIRYSVFLIITLIFLFSCTSRNRSEFPTDTPTSGHIKILADESFKPLIDAEIAVFTGLYRNAIITPVYKPEVDVVNYFLGDSAKVIVTTKKLTDDQIKYLRDILVVARTTTFAYDAVALVINKANTDSIFYYDDIKNIFTGKISSWKEINKNSQLDGIRVIFDSPKSGNIRYFREKFDYYDPLPANFYAMNSTPEVIEFVEKNKDAIGIVSVNWISDSDDSLSYNFSNRVAVAAISHPYLSENTFYKPDQGWIYNKSYPFTREVYLIKRESHTGLGSGFINWACAEQGQRIVLKAGLVPATMPIRMIQISQ